MPKSNNPLPSYWCGDLSRAWAGFQEQQQVLSTQPASVELLPFETVTKGWRADDPEMKTIHDVSPEMMKRGRQVDQHFYQKSGYVILEDEETRIRWIKQVY